MNSGQLPPRRHLSQDDPAPPKKRTRPASTDGDTTPDNSSRNRVLGVIGIVWGGGLLLKAFLTGESPSLANSYETGKSIGMLLGVLLLGSGIYYAVKG